MRDKKWILLPFISWLICGCATFETNPSSSKSKTNRSATANWERWSFVALADPRGDGKTWQNVMMEIRDMKTNPDPAFPKAELVVIAGDIDPIDARYKDYTTTFSDPGVRPLILPVIGNHDVERKGRDIKFIRDVMMPLITNAVRRHPTSCDYYLDHKNVRNIAVDAYNDLGKAGVINDEGRAWVEHVITSAPDSIDHIFITFHEPAFPRHRHLKDSFNADPEKRDAFWNMLVKHAARVRAVFVGHTHFYYRMRVKDPAGEAHQNNQSYPDEEGGIYQIDAGAAGNGKMATIVQVLIDGKDVHYRTIQAKDGDFHPFKKVDEWSMDGSP